MITLRAYNHEIESLIDRSQFDEAIAHCTAILTSYPKNINAYRNLGKALLESKKYSDASDIFKRVLSVFPDDFISHVGLSIIKEDERNLDLAIWHMEQAFDVQPSNLAIQEELKRLFGRRDGASPQKIRLTRGALVRMYARGELYQQAIAEILATLPEDPQRIDLQVILGLMHYLAGNLLDAAETCNQIIEKLPYCYQANKILEQIFTKNGNLENAKIYRERLTELDPYFQFSSEPDEVSDDLILLEKVNYVPTFSKQNALPDWTQAIGVSWEENAPNQNLDWLSDLEHSETEKVNGENINNGVLPGKVDQTSGFDEQPEKSNDTESDIPDWMKEAGWTPSSGEFEARENQNAQSFMTDKNENIEENLPSWLTESVKSELPVSSQTGSSEMSDIQDTIEIPIVEDTEPQIDVVKHAVDDWKQEVDMENINPDTTPEKDSSGSDQDWLKNLSSFSTEDKPVEKSDQDLPDWLKNFEQDQLESEEKDSDMPEWLRNLQASSENKTEPETNEVEFSTIISKNQDDIPESIEFADGLVEAATSEIVESDPEANLETRILQPVENNEPGQEETDVTRPQPLIGLPEDWQKEIESTEPPVEENTQEAQPGEVPDWVRSIISEKKIEEDLPSINGESDTNLVAESTSPFELPPQEETDIENGGVISGKTSEELLEWLRDLQPVDEDQSRETGTFESDLIPDEEPMDEATNPVLNRLNQISDSKSEPETLNEFVESKVQETTFPETEAQNELSVEDVISSPSEIKTEAVAETIETEIPTEKVDEASKSESPDFDQMVTLIESEQFSKIPPYVDELVAAGSSFNDLLALFNTYQKSKNNDYLYWQCLGDLNASQDKFAESIAAYEKAEVILTNNIK
jgi:tetratricopeptide (TPR) repeat protein